MNFSPKVSIVIPVYNGSNYMREAIDSALAQTYSNYEVIVVNDGSNDQGKTEAIAKSYGDRIRYYSKTNGGVASALNFAIREMKGEYFSWLSHDDVYLPNKVEAQIDCLRNHPEGSRRLIILYSDFYLIDSLSAVSGEFRASAKVRPEEFRLRLIAHAPIHGCTLLIPRDAFAVAGSFNEGLRTTQDYDLWFRMAKHYRFTHMPDLLIKGRAHAEQGSFTLNETAKRECREMYLEQLEPYLRHPEELYGKTEFTFSRLAIGLRKRGHKSVGDHLMQQIPAKFFLRELPGLVYYTVWPARFNRHFWCCIPAKIARRIFGKNYSVIKNTIARAPR